jgi:23S rRNA (adenine-N6)-dimethyltransferase
MRKRILYSQNFLNNKQLISSLIDKSSITKDDLVYEIGAGQGIITNELIKKSKGVVAFELDENLFNKLQTRFISKKNLDLMLGNFLEYSLPKIPYKIFANIPFNITTAIIKKITNSSATLIDAYLFVQKEAAYKFIGMPYANNSQVSILLYPFYEISLIYKFKNSDFFPKPNIDVVLLQINKRRVPLISLSLKSEYEDLVIFAFNQFKPRLIDGLSQVINYSQLDKLFKKLDVSVSVKPSELSQNNWLPIFQLFTNSNSQQKAVIKGAKAKQENQQRKLSKIYRTREDKNWRLKKKQNV